jgi:endonuclease/exonuclease/phosphatase family metal-dependent hydrolase
MPARSCLLLGLTAAAASLLGSACATAVNYLDPGGPLYETRHAPPLPEAANRPFRVVSFNIEYARHVDRAIEVLRGSPPLQALDLLALQEMDAPAVERVARALQLNSLYAPGGIHPANRRDFGCAVLSPWPLVEPRKVMLPHGAHGTGLRRAAVGATLLRPGLRVRVYCVHLPSPFGVWSGARRDQVRALLADAAGSPDPVVIAGDLNSHGIGEQFEARGYAWLTRDVGSTTSKLGVFKLAYDHVFAKGLLPVRPGPAAGVVRENRKASDHRPVWALLALGASESDPPEPVRYHQRR